MTSSLYVKCEWWWYYFKFSVLQIEYPLEGRSPKGSDVYFLLEVCWVIQLFCQIVLLFEINVVLVVPWWPDVTIVQSDITIVVPWQLSIGNIHDYLLLMGILFEILRIAKQKVVNVYLWYSVDRVPGHTSVGRLPILPVLWWGGLETLFFLRQPPRCGYGFIMAVIGEVALVL